MSTKVLNWRYSLKNFLQRKKIETHFLFSEQKFWKTIVSTKIPFEFGIALQWFYKSNDFTYFSFVESDFAQKKNIWKQSFPNV